MKRVFIGVLLVILTVITVTVCGDGNVENESRNNTVKMADVTVADEAAVSTAMLFGKVHATLLMAAEDAFGYLLNGNESERQSFYDRIALSEESFAKFEDASETSPENESELAAGYGTVMEQYGKMTDAADAMFTSYETEGKPIIGDVIAFEEVVDTVFNATDDAWTARRAESGLPRNADSGERALYVRLFSAVEESYAYPVLGDATEKENALTNFADFDNRLALYTDNFPEKSYDAIKAAKDEILQATETMFATYEKDGAVNATEVQALEDAVENLDNTYLALSS
jgi:hypothetical protein